MAKKDPYLIHTQLDYQCPWFSIHKEQIQYPNGYENDYYVFRREAYFTIIIAKQAEKFLVLKQWRPTLRQYLWEFCAGGIEKGEEPLQSAQRELAEEAGFQAKKWIYLGEFFVAPGYSTEKGFVFFAQDLEALPKGSEDNPLEIIEPHWWTAAELRSAMKTQTFNDGPSLSAWGMYNAS